MSIYYQVIRPSDGLVVATFGDPWGYYYRLGDGIELPVPVDYAWCGRCAKFVEAERLYPLEEIEETIAALAATRQDPSANSKAWRLQAEFDRWAAALAWRKSRQAPPRCLGCGSQAELQFLSLDRPVADPRGEGTLQVRVGGLALDAKLSSPVYFDGEGNRLA